MRNGLGNKGFTLVEMIIVMMLTLVVIMISASAFEQIVKKSGVNSRTAEGDIAGLVGLEMMRTDISHAGYGLPWAFQTTVAYTEPDNTQMPTTAVVISSGGFNGFQDSPSAVPPALPRAVISDTCSGACSTANPSQALIDYLVVKGTNLGMNRSAKRWNYVNYSGNSQGYWTPKADATTSLGSPNPDGTVDADQIITLNSTFSQAGTENRQLLVKSDGTYYYPVGSLVTSTIPNRYTAGTAFQSAGPQETTVAYGVGTGTLRMPYNRVDFYVDKTARKPASCAPGTGVLYKAVANNTTGGGFTTYPLLDCVGDMQVVYDRDINGDGTLTPVDESVTGYSGLTADQMRAQIKNVKVYILSHAGKKDLNFSYPAPSPIMNSDANNVVCVAPPNGTDCLGTVGRIWNKTTMASTFGADWRNYHWKVYSFTVNMKNLQ